MTGHGRSRRCYRDFRDRPVCEDCRTTNREQREAERRRKGVQPRAEKTAASRHREPSGREKVLGTVAARVARASLEGLEFPRWCQGRNDAYGRKVHHLLEDEKDLWVEPTAGNKHCRTCKVQTRGEKYRADPAAHADYQRLRREMRARKEGSEDAEA